MDQLAPNHVPFYETREQQRRLWERCADRGQPVVAVRDARRGYVVRYDLQHLDTQLSTAALARLRRRARASRPYPTANDGDADPISESEGVGGAAGPISGGLHADSEERARRLASGLSAVVFDQAGWQ